MGFAGDRIEDSVEPTDNDRLGCPSEHPLVLGKQDRTRVHALGHSGILQLRQFPVGPESICSIPCRELGCILHSQQESPVVPFNTHHMTNFHGLK